MNHRVQLLASAIAGRDPWAIAGSLLFGVGVALFLATMWHEKNA